MYHHKYPITSLSQKNKDSQRITLTYWSIHWPVVPAPQSSLPQGHTQNSEQEKEFHLLLRLSFLCNSGLQLTSAATQNFQSVSLSRLSEITLCLHLRISSVCHLNLSACCLSLTSEIAAVQPPKFDSVRPPKFPQSSQKFFTFQNEFWWVI